MESLWGEEFSYVESLEETKQAINKVKKAKKKSAKADNDDIEQKLAHIKSEVYRILGRYAEDTIVIKDLMSFVKYMDRAIEVGTVAVDTETNNSLDVYSCKLMGLCLYVPGEKSAYVPINHVNRHTGERLDYQLTEKDVKEQLDRLKDTNTILHNAKFDYQVIRKTCDCKLHLYWDTHLAGKLLDENEMSYKLKDQYQAKVDSTAEKYSIEKLFEGLEYAIVDVDIFALYAATDSFKTYGLYNWQLERYKLPDNQKLLKILLEVEMPICEVTAEMELTGVCIDTDYANMLSEYFHKRKLQVEQKLREELAKLKPKIDAWRLTADATHRDKIYLKVDKGKKPTLEDIKKYPNMDEKGYYKFTKSKGEQLSDPVSTTSPTQLQILFYDILGCPEVYDKKKKQLTRPTGEEALKALKFPICKQILEEREINKLLGTYIDKLPKCVREDTGRLHARFNQLGTDTGRYSSDNPNLQNIPSHVNSIRMMFVPSPGYAMVGCDYSQQEPRLLSSMSGDEAMRGAYLNGKDIYATMGCGVFCNNYFDNMEHYEDGTPNVEGKKRRKAMKILFLGISYGMGNSLIAERLGCTTKEAKEILDNFYEGFPAVKGWKDSIESFAKTNGYVEDLWGRRRRLPDLFLPHFETKFLDKEKNITFNPLLGSKGMNVTDVPILNKYKELAEKAKGLKEIEELIQKAAKDGVNIIDNSGRISGAERQCVNSVVQGSAATMTKKAMILAYNDKELNDLGFRMLLPIHDELIGECPKENVERVGQRLSELMISAPGNDVSVPFKCDCVVEPRWYFLEYQNEINEKIAELEESGMDPSAAKAKVCAENPGAQIVLEV